MVLFRQKSNFCGEKAKLHQSVSHRRRRLTSKERRQFRLLILMFLVILAFEDKEEFHAQQLMSCICPDLLHNP